MYNIHILYIRCNSLKSTHYLLYYYTYYLIFHRESIYEEAIYRVCTYDIIIIYLYK